MATKNKKIEEKQKWQKINKKKNKKKSKHADDDDDAFFLQLDYDAAD